MNHSPTQISPTCSVNRNPPINLTPETSSLFAHELHKILPPVYSYDFGPGTILPNGYLLSPRQILPNWISFAEPPTGSTFVAKAILKYLYFRLFRKSVLRLSGPVVFITDEFSNGYFHWIADVLPRIVLLLQTGIDISQYTVVVPSMAVYSYVQPSLQPFGFGSIVLGTPNQWIQSSNIQVLGPPAPTGNYRPELLQVLSKTVLSFFGLPTSGDQPGKKLYISRSQAPKRKVLQEEELTPGLESLGFQMVVLENLGFAEQVQLLSQARVLVGLHGAGLTNMMWMPPGSVVLELRFPDDSDNNCYFSMASALGHRYAFYIPSLDQESDDTHSANLSLEPSDLLHFLKQF